MAENKAAKSKDEAVMEIDLFPDGVPGDSSSDSDPDFEVSPKKLLTEENSKSDMFDSDSDATPESEAEVPSVKGTKLENLVYLKDDTYTRAQVMLLLEQHKDSSEKETLSQHVAPCKDAPRNSLDDFKLPVKNTRTKLRLARGDDNRNFAKTEEQWVEECDEAQKYLQDGILPFRCEANRHTRKNFIKRVKSRFCVSEGRLRYWTRRTKTSEGTYFSGVVVHFCLYCWLFPLNSCLA